MYVFGSRRLLSSATVVFVLLTVITHVISDRDPSYVDTVVRTCVAIATDFARTEEKYAKGDRKKGEPVLAGLQDRTLQLKVYESELYQRPFECISDKLNVTSDEELMQSFEYQNLVQVCKSTKPTPQCDPTTKFRTIDGTCNNLYNTGWGSSLSCANRLFPASYEGVSGLRRSVRNKKPLPDNRSISLAFPDWDKLTLKYNSLMVFFLQSLAHDVTDYASSFIKDKHIECCANPNGKDQHPQCAPSFPTDLFYKYYNVTCLDFVRRAMCKTCSVGERLQVNLPTSFIDGSIIYGLYDDKANDLRANDGTGKLEVQKTEAGDLLCIDKSPGLSRCGDAEKGEFCFKSGDRRVNQHTFIMMLQTLYMREHNRVAEELKNMNSHWDDETLFQEARRIIIAEIQVITFNEGLPVVIGADLMSQYELELGQSTKYDSQIDPSILAEFNAAAFRLHSIVPGKVIYFAGFSYLENWMRKLFFDAEHVYDGEMELFLKQMVYSPAQKYDRHITRDVTDFLYRELDGSYGFDLAAANIKRGRDQGVPSYTDLYNSLWTEKKKITDFDDLYSIMDPICVDRFKRIYSDVRDIDLWMGLICEKVGDGMIVSPTAAEIIAIQFRRLKFGDRFYFEHTGYFTEAQVETLRNASLARIICDNTDITRMHPRAMEFPPLGDILTSCTEIPGVNLDEWGENTTQ